MIFDLSIVSSWHLGLLLGIFIAMYVLLHGLIQKKPVSWRVHSTGKPIYFAGWLLALFVMVPSAIALNDMRLAVGLIGATLMIVAIGRLDEDKNISVPRQLFWQALIALWAIYFGWTILHISNPFGSGVIIIGMGGLAAFAWLLLCMNAMNFLDGTDGLATLVGIIAFIALAGISVLPATQDPRTLILSLIAIGALLAFFLWNAPKARVYLGTSGSWFLGLFLGMTAIIGGGKIATALIVLALPVLDALFVVFYRMRTHKNPTKGDTTSHIHHRLLSANISPWGILLIIGVVTALLGGVAVAAPTNAKIIILGIFACVFFWSRWVTMKKRK